MPEPEVAVVYSPREWLEQLDRFVFDHGGVRIRAKVVDRRDAVEESCQVLVVDDFTAFLSRGFVDEVHRLDRRVLGVYDLGEVSGDEPLSAGLERLRQCGVDDVIEASAPPSEFVAAVAALAESAGARLEAELGLVAPEPPLERREEPDSTRGFVTVVASPPGGCGASEIAIAMGAALARRGDGTAVVDADDLAPSLAQRMGLGLYPNLRAGIQAVEEGTGDLDRALVRVREGGFDAMAGLSRPRDWAAVRPFEVAEMIRSLALIRQQVVVNAGPCLEDLAWLGQPERFGIARHLVGLADSLVVVGRADPVGVKRLLEWLAEARTLSPGTPIHVVINFAGRGTFKRGEIEDEIRRAVPPATLAFVPADERVREAAWAGTPVARGPFTRAVDRLVQTAIPRVSPPARTKRPIEARP
jgi:MinD-like ATPase involved in chromosome partitioning or flagellar assembly